MFIHGAAATPMTLVAAMAKHGKCNNLECVKTIHMHTEGPFEHTAPDMAEHFQSVSTFMGGNVRQAVADGRGSSIPIFLHEIPLLFKRKIYRPDVALISVCKFSLLGR